MFILYLRPYEVQCIIQIPTHFIHFGFVLALLEFNTLPRVKYFYTLAH